MRLISSRRLTLVFATWCALLASFSVGTAHARDWFVSGDGDDTQDGSRPEAAFRTLQKAQATVQPGDVVWVGDGLYTNGDKSDGGAVLNITRSGRTDAWITWKARPGHRPEVRAMGWAGIQISASYQVIDGFHVIGNNDSIALIHALEDAKKPKPDATFNSNGILIEGRRNAADNKPHHIVVRNCVVAKNPGGGISALEADHVTIEDNLVFDNAWFMRYGGSGITFLNNWQRDQAPGYHIVIQRNRVWNNKTLVPWERTGKLSDGNGILLDVTDGVATGGATNPNADVVNQSEPAVAAATGVVPPSGTAKAQRPAWTARSLIANNLSAFNGGSGIHTFRTAHVDIVNNTTYWNGSIVDYEELFANRSDDIVIINNIIVPRPGGRVTSNNRNTRVQWDFNLYPAVQSVIKGGNDIVADPQFFLVDTDLRRADFRLRAGSRGIDTGAAQLPQVSDLAGSTRPRGTGRDRGAYEQ